MYIFHTTEMPKTALPHTLKRTFREKIQFNKNKAAELEGQMTSAQNDIDALRKKDIDKRNRQTELRNIQTDLDIQMKGLAQTLASSTDTFNQLFVAQAKFLNAITSQELYTIGSKIQKIFNKNSLKSSINEQIVLIDKYIADELAKIKTYKDNLLTLLRNWPR